MIKLLTHAKNRNFLRLWIAQLISQFGDRIHQFALIALIAERSGSSVGGLSKVIAFTILPVFFIQPFAGVFVDRFDRRTTLFICDLARGLLILLIPLYFIFQSSMIPIYIIVFLAFSFSRFHVPAKMSIIPDLVKAEELIKANSLVSTTALIAFVFGAGFGGFLIEQYGARDGFIIDAATFFLSAFFLMNMDLVWRLRIDKKKIDDAKKIAKEASISVWREMGEGFKYLIEHKEIRFVIALVYVLLSAAGATYVVAIVFIQETFGSVTKDLGVLSVAIGLGLFIGFMAYGKWGKLFKWYNTIFYCLLFGGLMMIVFSWGVHYYANLYLACVLAVVWGMILGPIFIASNTVIQSLSDDNMRGKMFSALEIVIHFAFMVAMLASSLLSKYVDSVWILIGVGVSVSLISLIGLANKNIRTLKG